MTRFSGFKQVERFAAKFPKLVPLSSPQRATGTDVSSFVNEISYGLKDFSYLEIGVQTGKTIAAINAASRVAVDPNPQYLRFPSRGIKTFSCSSDVFFAHQAGMLFDIIYLDGLHHFQQTWRDLMHATRVVKPYGVILIDDVVPIDKFSALIPQDFALEQRVKNTGSLSTVWHGDIFKVAMMLSEISRNFSFTFGTINFKRNPRSYLFCADGDWSNLAGLPFDVIADIDKLRPESVFRFGPRPTIPNDFNPIGVDEAASLLKVHLHRGNGSL